LWIGINDESCRIVIGTIEAPNAGELGGSQRCNELERGPNYRVEDVMVQVLVAD
jgi:hypothetical protein